MSTDRGDDGGGTPGTSADPETTAEGDTDQLELDDMLLERGVGDLLDEGYSPPDRPPNPHRLETDLDQELGAPLDEKLAEEEPEVWDTDPGPDVGAREPDRAGRLTAAEPDATGWPKADTRAVDVGVAGGAASAEEAAMHLIGEDQEAVQDEIELAEELGEEDEQD
jgi:hypothetical protein